MRRTELVLLVAAACAQTLPDAHAAAQPAAQSTPPTPHGEQPQQEPHPAAAAAAAAAAAVQPAAVAGSHPVEAAASHPHPAGGAVHEQHGGAAAAHAPHAATDAELRQHRATHAPHTATGAEHAKPVTISPADPEKQDGEAPTIGLAAGANRFPHPALEAAGGMVNRHGKAPVEAHNREAMDEAMVEAMEEAEEAGLYNGKPTELHEHRNSAETLHALDEADETRERIFTDEQHRLVEQAPGGRVGSDASDMEHDGPKDDNPLCMSWAIDGECIRNPQFMWMCVPPPPEIPREPSHLVAHAHVACSMASARVDTIASPLACRASPAAAPPAAATSATVVARGRLALSLWPC